MVNRIYVLGGWFGEKNIGDEAILIGIEKILNKVFPEAEIYASTVDADYTKKISDVHVVYIGSLKSFRAWKTILENVLKADLVVVSGGTPLYDYAYRDILINLGLPIFLRKKVVFLGISSKKIKTKKGKKIVKYLVENSKQISVREPVTIDILRNCGVKKNIELTGDSALVIEPLPYKKINKNKKPVLGLCPRMLSQNFKYFFHSKIEKKDINNIQKNIAKIADYFSEDFDILFIPFHQKYGDVKYIKDIIKMMENKNVSIEKSIYPLETLKLINKADIIFGTRLHSLIFSAIQNKPVVTIDYDPKIGGFMKFIKQDEYMGNPDSSAQELIKLIENAWKNRKKVKKEIKENIEEARKKIIKNAQKMKSFV